MKQEIEKLLNKKKLTAVDVGRAYIMNCIKQQDIKEARLVEEELKILASKISNKSEVNQVVAYANLYNWMQSFYALMQAHYQQFYVGYSKLFFRVVFTLNAEMALGTLQELTLTKKKDHDYQELKEFTENTLSSFSLFAVQDSDIDIQFTKAGRDYVKTGLMVILSYNKAVDLIAKFLKVPRLTHSLKIETENLFAAINLLNDKTATLKELLIGSKEEIEIKKRFLDDLCPNFDLIDYEPTPEAIKKASNSVKKYILQNDPFQIIKILQRTL